MSRFMWTMTLRHPDKPPVTWVRDREGMESLMLNILSYRDPRYTLVCVTPAGDQGFTVSFK